MKNDIKPLALLRIFLGLVFLSAGLYRVLNWHEVTLEFSNLKLNSLYLPILIIILEIGAGIFLILNIKLKESLLVLIIFLIFTLIWTLVIFGKDLISKSSELFTFQTTPTDFFLHLSYLVILIYLFSVAKIKN